MVNAQSVEKQLKKLKFNMHSWGRSEARELPGILMEDEEIYEAVNGIYEGGFALLVATDMRVLLVDKKPLNYLTVEDFRFDMINEIDYNHRLFGAHISLSAGSKNLKFTSYNQPRLRKLVNHIQHCIAAGKKHETTQREDQKNHLEQINQQLQAYLLAQHKHQQDLEEQIKKGASPEVAATKVPDIKPSPELSDFLYAQSLMAQHEADRAKKQYDDVAKSDAEKLEAPTEQAQIPAVATPVETASEHAADDAPKATQGTTPQMAELYAEGLQEVFGKAPAKQAQIPKAVGKTIFAKRQPTQPQVSSVPLEPNNPMRIAYSKLPMALRNRRFGRPLFHEHSKSEPQVTQQRPVIEQ